MIRPMNKYLIIVPTYNEKNNIEFITNKIKKIVKFRYNLLFIDDNSNDGTKQIISKIKSKNIRT